MNGILGTTALATVLATATATLSGEHPEQLPPPCHARQGAQADMAQVRKRNDIKRLPAPLQDAIVRMAGRPHSVLPVQAQAEADSPSLLFQYYVLDTQGFEPNPFTATFPGVNDEAQLTATGANCGLPTIGAVRLVVEPKPGLPTDPNDVEAFIDVFTDISGLFVINNESGWYEGWMIWDMPVAQVGPPRGDGHAQFGQILAADADALANMGSGHNVPGNLFTTDGNAKRLPGAADHFPDSQSNVVPLHLSMGAYNCLQQSDCHSYWEFNYTTNWVHPLYELPFTGGIPGTFEAGQIGALSSLIPGSGPNGVQNDPVTYGDNPNTAGVLRGSGPRDPDKFEADDETQNEFRERFIPSGLAKEILLDVYERPASYEHGVTNFSQRLFDAYRDEVARVDQDGDGVISALEGDVDSASDGFDNNERLFIPATKFKRFAVTREINDGLLAPRFAPSQRGWVLGGKVAAVSPPVQGSTDRDGDDR
jgi:hypothetical protein